MLEFHPVSLADREPIRQKLAAEPRQGCEYAFSSIFSYSAKYPIFVAETEEGVKGYAFCVFRQHLNDTCVTDIKTLYIDDLCVDEKCRGQHIGRQLYEFVLRFARESGCYNVTLNVWCCNPGAITFYESCGLVPQKIGMEQIIQGG